MSTRMRGGRSDWDSYTVTRQSAELALMKLHAGQALTDREQELLRRLPQPGKERAPPVQHEATEARHLAVEAYRRWWYPGWTAIEHRTAYAREADARGQQGVKTGLPDSMLLIPGSPWQMPRQSVRCVVELKAPSHQPKRDPGEAWWINACDGKTHYGLRPDQRWWLRTMAACGFHTFVAFSALEALSWLDEKAGARPEVLPW